MKTFGLMMDCSRDGVAKPSYVKEWIDRIAKLGMNSLMLYTEDTYEVEGEPYFGYQRGRYSTEELRELDDYAAEKGVELIPCIQTLAHVRTIFRWIPYRSMNDCDDIMLCEEPRTYELIEAMFATLARTFRTRTVHVGMDEAHMIGRGRYQDLHGACNHTEVLLRHLVRVAEIGRKYGFTLLMWSDMFFRTCKDYDYLSDKEFPGLPEEIRARIPENVELVYWDYYYSQKAHYDHQFEVHDMVKKTKWFAGGLWTWTGFAAHNAHAFEVSRAAMESVREHDIENVTFTLWGDNGAETSFMQVLPALWNAVCLARGITDEAEISRGFEKEFGIPFADYLLLDLPDTPNDKAVTFTNPDKFMLYSDPFLGIFDSAVLPGGAADYAACARKLEKYIDHPVYGYLFRQQYTLAKVLSRKYDLSVRLHAAYRAGDKEAARKLLVDMDLLLADIQAFYNAFEERWMRENKPFGFEVHDARLGGLMMRLGHCISRLGDWVRGNTDSVPELETETLPAFAPEDEIYNNTYTSIVTPSAL